MKKIIILITVTIAVLLIYFLVFFFPSQNKIKAEQEKRDFLFNKKTECMEICKKLYENDTKELPGQEVPGQEYSAFNPVYSYNEVKNACFYSGGSILGKNFLSKRVVNCQTNQEVLTLIVYNDKVSSINCDTCAVSSDDFDRREKEFISQ